MPKRIQGEDNGFPPSCLYTCFTYFSYVKARARSRDSAADGAPILAWPSQSSTAPQMASRLTKMGCTESPAACCKQSLTMLASAQLQAAKYGHKYLLAVLLGTNLSTRNHPLTPTAMQLRCASNDTEQAQKLTPFSGRYHYWCRPLVDEIQLSSRRRIKAHVQLNSPKQSALRAACPSPSLATLDREATLPT